MNRDAIVDRVRGWLEASGYPRLHAACIVFLAGATAFLVSVLLLGAGVGSMALRYALAGCAGYVTFILLIRVWIGWQRRRLAGEDDLAAELLDPTLWDLRIPRSSGHDPVPLLHGGRSGGAGASGEWGGPVSRTGGSTEGGGWSLDLDDLFWLVIVAAAVFGGAVAIGYVIYSAPLLLGEVAVDAAIVSAAYRKLRSEEVGHWSGAVLRRTWLPASIVIVTLAVAGFALQQAVPDARSIGGVVRSLTAR